MTISWPPRVKGSRYLQDNGLIMGSPQLGVMVGIDSKQT